jgi:hypothetical protein
MQGHKVQPPWVGDQGFQPAQRHLRRITGNRERRGYPVTDAEAAGPYFYRVRAGRAGRARGAPAAPPDHCGSRVMTTLPPRCGAATISRS